MRFWIIFKAITISFLTSLFAGLVILSIGVGALFQAVHFPGLWLAEYEFATDVNLRKENYSYKPGQSGTTLNYTFINASGTERDVTLRVITYSGLIYALAFDLAALLAASFTKIRLHNNHLNLLQQWTSYALSLAIIVSFGSMAILMAWSFGSLIMVLIKAW